MIAAAVAVPAVRFFYHAPTCTDGIRNQGETSIDKGGPCPLLDISALKPAPLKFVRAYPVRTGEYAATAYVENPNKDAAVMKANYKFSFYDADNILVAEREGTTVIMPGAITPVYVSQLISGTRVIAHSFFKFTNEPLVWVKAQDQTDTLSVKNIRAEDLGTAPKVSADVSNIGIEDRNDITYVVTLFDGAGNAFAASRTIVPTLSAGATEHVVFTWPSPLMYNPTRIDVLPVMKPRAF